MRIIIAILLFSLWAPAYGQSNTESVPRDELDKQSKLKEQKSIKLLELRNRAVEASELAVTNRSQKQITTLKNQMGIWQQIIELDSSNDINWMNYYLIQRNIFLSENSGRLTQANKDSLTKISKTQKAARPLCLRCPPKFGEEIMDYFEADFDSEIKENRLARAERINPGNALLFPEKAKMAEFKRDIAERDKYCQKIKEINEATTVSYYTHLCSMVDEGSILFTNGEYDTYALWLAQKQAGKKFYIFSLSLFENAEYRQKMLKEAGIETEAKFDVLNPSAFIKSMLENNKNKIFYLSLTVNPQYLSGIKNNLYNVGLAYRYSAQTFNNIPALEANLLKHDFSLINSSENVLVKNYMQGFIILYRKYNNNKPAAEKAKAAARQIAVKSGFWDEYKKYFGE